MAVISEEMGIVGAIIVIGGLGFIVLRALYIAIKQKIHRPECSQRELEYHWNPDFR